MKKKLFGFIVFSVCFVSFLFSGQKIKEKDLPLKYREFLKLTSYIIMSEEKNVFLQLTINRDRDIFIETFWRQRDPTPGTPDNEYRKEHIKRFAYANKFYGRSTPREGWVTDMGRFHIILGEPVSKGRWEGTQGIVPVQAWYYYGDKKKGLPPHFAIVFFKRGGAGEWRLYDHLADGPSKLLEYRSGIEFTDFESLYERIRELGHTLCLVSHSMIPGDIPYNFQPSPMNNLIMADILNSPKKDINPTYATHFLNYKGIVSTEYLTNYIKSNAHVALIQDPDLGINFLHFSLAPETISMDYYEPRDQYYCNFKLNVSLRVGDFIIYQYTRDFPFYFSPDDLPKIRANGVAVEDSFPLIPGDYKLIILLQNSVGKEFTTFESDIHNPEETGAPRIDSLLLGYRFQSYQTNLHIPFKVQDSKLFIDPKKNFAASDSLSFFFNVPNMTQTLWEKGKVRVSILGMKPNDPSERSYELTLSRFLFHGILFITQTIPANELSPDYYQMKLTLLDENGEIIDEQREEFVISPIQAVSHPIAHSKAFSLNNRFLYFYMLAQQHERVGNQEQAEASFEKAYNLNPGYNKGLLAYANFLFNVNKFTKSLELIENIREDENLKFEYHLTKGKAYMGLARFNEAIESFLEGNKIYNSNIGLLNSLGFCYYKKGDKKEALGILKASLQLNPKQENTKRLVAEIEKIP